VADPIFDRIADLGDHHELVHFGLAVASDSEMAGHLPADRGRIAFVELRAEALAGPFADQPGEVGGLGRRRLSAGS
jgi:hypothetical protein